MEKGSASYQRGDGFLCKAPPKAVFRFAKGEEENNPVPALESKRLAVALGSLREAEQRTFKVQGSSLKKNY